MLMGGQLAENSFWDKNNHEGTEFRMSWRRYVHPLLSCHGQAYACPLDLPAKRA